MGDQRLCGRGVCHIYDLLMGASDRNPMDYARSKRALMVGWATGEVGRLVRAAAAVVAPGTPVAGWLGFASNGVSLRSNTTGWLTGSASERAEAARTGQTPIRLGDTRYDPRNASLWSNRGFHELGIFGVEGGRASGPAPGPGDHGTWHRLASDAQVRAILGRAATTAPGGWVAAEDQIAVGMVGVARHARGVRALMPESLRWPVNASGDPSAWSCWSLACAFMAWSAGDAGAARHLRIGAEAAARVPEAVRWEAWLSALVASGQGGAARSHANPSYSAVRTAQKLEAGRVAATATAEAWAPEWLRGGVTDARAEALYPVLVARGYGASGSSGGSQGSGSSMEERRRAADAVGRVIGEASGALVRRSLQVLAGGVVVGVGAALGLRWARGRLRARDAY